MSTWSNITEGYTYEFCFLKIDIAGHSEISKALRTKAVENTLNQFEDYVEEIVTSHRGQIWSWQGDGGLCAFYEDHNEVDKFHDAVQCGIALLEGLTEFNRTSKISEDIQVRIAVHSGNAKYKEEKGRIHSEVINFVAHLEQNSDVNAISISEAVWRQCREELQRLFHLKKEKFEGVSVYICEKYGPGISKNWMAVRKGIDTIVKKLRDGSYHPDLVIGFGRSGAIIGAMLAGNLGCKGFCSLDRRVTKQPRSVQVENTAQLNAERVKEKKLLLALFGIRTSRTVEALHDYVKSLGALEFRTATLYLSEAAQRYFGEAEVYWAYIGEVKEQDWSEVPWVITKDWTYE